MTPPVSPHQGLRLGDRYELTERIAGGGMGEVWQAHDEVLHRTVAVKLLRGEHAGDAGFLERFRAEARNAASLSHPGIAAVYDYGEEGGTAYLVMELVPGEPLSARIAREGALPAAAAVPLLVQAARALDAAHAAGVVHRDVKPGNLLITPDGTLKITDFGIARVAGQVPMTRTGEVMGTAQYLSPEQAQGRPTTYASDVYSLGVVAHEMLTGAKPFSGDTPVATAMAHITADPPPLPATVPAGLAATVLAMLAKDPEARPASAGAVAEAFASGTAAAGLAGAAPVDAGATQVITSGQPVAGDDDQGGTRVMPAVGAGAAGAAGAAAAAGYPTSRAEAQDFRRERAESRGAGVRRALLTVAALLLVGVGAFLLAQALGDGDGTPAAPVPTSSTPSSTSSTTTSEEPSETTSSTTTTQAPSPTTSTPTEETVEVDGTKYVGQPANKVVKELEKLGLVVTTTDIADSGLKEGTVLEVTPSGTVPKGSEVEVLVAAGQDSPVNPDD